MANRWKKNGSKETVIEGEYRRRFADDDPLERHRSRWYGDPDYRNRRGGDAPSRPPQKRFNYTVPLDPRDAERLRKLADRDKLEKRIASTLFKATRVVNPLARAHSIYKAFEPILKDIEFDWGEGFSFSKTGGAVFEGPLAGTYELKCTQPGVPVDTYGSFNGHNNATTCGLSGQAQPNGWMNFNPPLPYGFEVTTANLTRTFIFSHGYLIGGSVQRKQYAMVYWQTAQAGLNVAGSYIRRFSHRLTPDFAAMPDPNFMRNQPAEPEHKPAYAGSPVDRYLDALDSAGRPYGAVVIKPGTSTGGGRPGGPTISPTKPGPPKPPGKGQRERKGLSTMRVVLSMLDTLSEAAEIVDAVYEALPKKVQRRWGCGKIKRGLIDNAGQYGIDGADCKLRAIWHNLFKVDLEKAVRNIIANEIQDRVIGGIARASPVNVGRATDEANKLVNELLERLFEESGLKPNEERN